MLFRLFILIPFYNTSNPPSKSITKICFHVCLSEISAVFFNDACDLYQLLEPQIDPNHILNSTYFNRQKLNKSLSALLIMYGF